MRQYIGARYMPKFMGTYDPTTAYEALSVVDNGMGTSYVSNKPTPAGTPLTDTTYWAVYGSVSGAVLDLQDQIDDINTGLGKIIKNDISLDQAETLHGTNYALNDSNISGDSNGYMTVNDGALKGVNYSTYADEGIRLTNKGVVLDSKISNNGSQGVCSNTTSNNMLISDNDITAVNYPVLIDQNATGSGAIIDSNFINGSEGDGVELNNPNGGFSEVVVSDNIISAGADGGSGTSSGMAVGMAKAKNVVVSGNVSKYSRNEGLHIENAPKHVIVNGNVFDNCNNGGVYLDQRYGSAVTDVGDIVIHSNNRYVGNGTQTGIETIYTADVDDLIVYDNNNIYSDFAIGIYNVGRTANQNHRVFNDIITGCDVGIKTRKDVHGDLIIDNCNTAVLIERTANRVIFDSLNILRAPAYDHVITFEDTTDSSRCVLKNFKISKDVSATSSESMIKAPKFAKGIFIVEAQQPSNVFKIYEIDGTTLTEIDSNGYGAVTASLAIDSGILKAQINQAYTGSLMITFSGVYVIQS